MASEILMAGRVCGGGETQGLLDALLCRFAAFLVCLDCRFFAIKHLLLFHPVTSPDVWLPGTSNRADTLPPATAPHWERCFSAYSLLVSHAISRHAPQRCGDDGAMLAPRRRGSPQQWSGTGATR